MCFLILPITTLYDENIDWPKLFEQKTQFEYIVPRSALKWGSVQKGPRDKPQRN